MRADAVEVPVPEMRETGTSHFWGTHPLSLAIRDGIANLSPSVRKSMGYFDSLSPVELAKMIDHGLITEWPWEFTKKGRAAYSRRRGRK